MDDEQTLAGIEQCVHLLTSYTLPVLTTPSALSYWKISVDNHCTMTTVYKSRGSTRRWYQRCRDVPSAVREARARWMQKWRSGKYVEIVRDAVEPGTGCSENPDFPVMIFPMPGDGVPLEAWYHAPTESVEVRGVPTLSAQQMSTVHRLCMSARRLVFCLLLVHSTLYVHDAAMPADPWCVRYHQLRQAVVGRPGVHMLPCVTAQSQQELDIHLAVYRQNGFVTIHTRRMGDMFTAASPLHAPGPPAPAPFCAVRQSGAWTLPVPS